MHCTASLPQVLPLVPQMVVHNSQKWVMDCSCILDFQSIGSPFELDSTSVLKKLDEKTHKHKRTHKAPSIALCCGKWCNNIQNFGHFFTIWLHLHARLIATEMNEQGKEKAKSITMAS